MKRKLLKGLSFFVILGLFMTFTSCNSGSKSKTEDKADFNQEAYDQQIQGVFEYLSPNQGLSVNYDKHFIFIFGNSDTSMVCQAGSYTVSRDTVIFTTQYATDPELVGTSIKWSAPFTDNDSIKFFLFDDSGNITFEFYSKRLVKVDENIVSQMKDIEGFYQYAAPNRGLSTMLGGYYIYLYGQPDGEMIAQAGKYKVDKDKTTCKNHFATNPQLIGVESDWIKKSVIGNTLTWVTIDDKGEITSTGKSVRPE